MIADRLSIPTEEEAQLAIRQLAPALHVLSKWFALEQIRQEMPEELTNLQLQEELIHREEWSDQVRTIRPVIINQELSINQIITIAIPGPEQFKATMCRSLKVQI
jgi:hypothetical protein